MRRPRACALKLLKMVDVPHVSDETIEDVLEASRARDLAGKSPSTVTIPPG